MVQLKNTEDRFGGVSRVFHWAMAFMILFLLITGLRMVEMPLGPEKFERYTIHKSFGMIILGLAVLRVSWRFISAPPRHLKTHGLWERFLSKTIHGVFYVSFFVMPLSGWLMSSAGEYTSSFFGVFNFPALSGKNEQLFEVMRVVHEVSAFILVGGIGLHILGALKHHVMDKDETLRRMGGNLVIGIFGLVLLSIPTFLFGQKILNVVRGPDAVQSETFSQASSSAREPTQWIIDQRRSSIEFSFMQYGSAVQGSFGSFDGTINFDPENLDDAFAKIMIDVPSIATGSHDRDQQARSGEWFDAEKFPYIVFESARFESLDANRSFEVRGTLGIRDVVLPVSFPFSFYIQEDPESGAQIGIMDAQLSLNRLDFGVGQGVWQQTDAIEDAVNIKLHVEAAYGF